MKLWESDSAHVGLKEWQREKCRCTWDTGDNTQCLYLKFFFLLITIKPLGKLHGDVLGCNGAGIFRCGDAAQSAEHTSSGSLLKCCITHPLQWQHLLLCYCHHIIKTRACMRLHCTLIKTHASIWLYYSLIQKLYRCSSITYKGFLSPLKKKKTLLLTERWAQHSAC